MEAFEHYMLARLFRRAGVSLDKFVIYYADNPYLLQQLAEEHPAIVLAMGVEALDVLIGSTDIIRWVGRVKTMRLYDGATQTDSNFPVIFNFAPDRLLARRGYEDDDDEEIPGKKKARRGIRNPPRFQGLAVGIIRKALHIIDHPITVLPTHYLQDPLPEEFAKWADQCLEHLARTVGGLSWDIETPYKLKERDEEEYDEQERVEDNAILRISFCYSPGHAVSVPWQAPWLPTIRRLLAFPGCHIGWNIINFDVPIVEANGVSVCGTVLDYMDGFHLLQPDLDKGLEFVSSIFTDLAPWKHLAGEFAQEALYSCIDADAALRNSIGIAEAFVKQGIWQLFLQQMKLTKILNAAGARGNCIDGAAQKELETLLSEKLRVGLMKAQELVEPQFLRVKPYVRLPKFAIAEEWQEFENETPVRVCSVCGARGVSEKTHPCCKTKGAKVESIMLKTKAWARMKLRPDTSLEGVKSWLQFNGFNPNSSDQMLAYMKEYDHPVGYNHKTGSESADSKQLLKNGLRYNTKGHRIYLHTVELHKISKALSTYVIGMTSDEHGRVHSHYVNSPWTWRLASKNVNMQNQGKRKSNPYAMLARKTIVASPGCTLVQADSSAIEAVFVGYFMGDQKYIELARKGIHAYVCCQKLGWDFTPDNIKRVKAEQLGLYDAIKMVIHGTSFGMTPYLMHMERPDLFPQMKNAKETQALLFEVLPGLKEWHWNIRVAAHKTNSLISPWGVKFYFYDVFTYKIEPATRTILYGPDGKPLINLGKDGNRVVACLPQSSGGFFCRDNLVLLGETEASEWMPANVTVHDGYCLDVPNARVPDAIEILGTILTRPISQMNGLRIGCEIEVGQNWGEMEQVKVIKIDT
jgi:hypothetical protein